MLFFVNVNNQFLVKIDAHTNGGAEHAILDNIKGAQTALAYSADDEQMSGDLFQSALIHCEFVSLDELQKKLADRAKADAAFSDSLSDLILARDSLERIQRELQAASIFYYEKLGDAKRAALALQSANVNCGYHEENSLAAQIRECSINPDA